MPCSGAPLLLFNNNVFLQKSAYILSVADIFRIYFRKRLIHAMSFISPDVWWSNWSSQDRQNFSSSHTWTISAELRATSLGMEPTSRQIKGVDADPKAPGLGSCVKWHCTGVSWVQCAPVKEKRPKMRWRLKAAGQQQCILNHPLITHTHTHTLRTHLWIICTGHLSFPPSPPHEAFRQWLSSLVPKGTMQNICDSVTSRDKLWIKSHAMAKSRERKVGQ